MELLWHVRDHIDCRLRHGVARVSDAHVREVRRLCHRLAREMQPLRHALLKLGPRGGRVGGGTRHVLRSLSELARLDFVRRLHALGFEPHQHAPALLGHLHRRHLRVDAHGARRPLAALAVGSSRAALLRRAPPKSRTLAAAKQLRRLLAQRVGKLDQSPRPIHHVLFNRPVPHNLLADPRGDHREIVGDADDLPWVRDEDSVVRHALRVLSACHVALRDQDRAIRPVLDQKGHLVRPRDAHLDEGHAVIVLLVDGEHLDGVRFEWVARLDKEAVAAAAEREGGARQPVDAIRIAHAQAQPPLAVGARPVPH
eukprot:87081-Pleurochrysis_carterae.AAC.3